MHDNVFTLDFETTGVDSKTCHPVEVALYCPNGEFESLISCSEAIPHEASAVHHIIADDLIGQPEWLVVRSALARLVESVEGRLPVLVAHNAEYERNILLRAGLPEFPPVMWICTYKAALRVWPDAPSHKNEVLRYWLGLGSDRGRNGLQKPHSALHDAKVTYLLLQALLEHATIEQMVEWTEQPAKLPKMPMGKHFGQTWDSIPGPYLEWCLRTADLREDVKHCAKQELDRRRRK